MFRHLTMALLLAGAGIAGSACSDEDNGSHSGPDASPDVSGDLTDSADGEDANTSPFEPRSTSVTVPFETDCESSERPIVMAHGFLAAGDTYGNHIRRFVNNGYCIDDLYVFDWNTVGLAPGTPPEELLEDFIAEVRSQHGGQKVDLMGHSAGGRLGYDYLSSASRAETVANYVHIASFDNEGPAGPEGSPVPTLNLYSTADTVVAENDGIEGATNVVLTEEDHYEVATSESSFEAIYEFLHDGASPATTAIGNSEEAWIYGKALTLGENDPASEKQVAIYEIDPTTGVRLDADPIEVFDITENGFWGPFLSEPGTRYELFVDAVEEDDVPVHYYIEPAVASNPVVYLRTLPAPDSIAGAFLSGLPLDSTDGAVIVFFANAAVEAGTNSVKLGEQELATSEIASPEDTMIALFLFDENENEESEFEPIGVFSSLPFLNGLDVYFDENSTEPVTIDFDGTTLTTPVWSTSTEGVSILLFD